MKKDKINETSLVLTTGLLLIYIITKAQYPYLLYLALAFGLIGIFVKPLAKQVTVLWFKLADVLNYIMTKVILGLVFYLMLVPIAMLYRLVKHDKFQLKKASATTWVDRSHTYKKADLENIW